MIQARTILFATLLACTLLPIAKGDLAPETFEDGPYKVYEADYR